MDVVVLTGDLPPSYHDVAGRSVTPGNTLRTSGIGGVWYTPTGAVPSNPPPYTDTLPGYNDRYISPRDLSKYYRSSDHAHQRIRRHRVCRFFSQIYQNTDSAYIELGIAESVFARITSRAHVKQLLIGSRQINVIYVIDKDIK